jgi:hypothetical protein
MLAECARESPLFAQIAVASALLSGVGGEQGHQARLTGTVVRVFAGESSWLGRDVVCLVPILLDGDHPPPSGTMWKRWEQMQSSRFLEAFLSPDEPTGELRVVLGMCSPIEAPTDTPVDDFRTYVDTQLAPSHNGRVAISVAVVLVLGGLAALVWSLSLLVR